MRLRSIIFVLILLSLPVVYSTAFAATSIELTRTVNMNVDTDANGIITLIPNPEYGIVKVDNGTLSIEPSNVGASSLNKNAILSVGNTQDPSTSEAFTIQNASGQTVQLNISLYGTNSYTGGTNSVVYYIEQNGTVTSVAVGETKSFQLSDGEEIYVSVETTSVNTTGNLSTRLEITGGAV